MSKSNFIHFYILENMLSSSKEPKNIPISLSLLHELEYNNICLVFNLKIKQAEKRRAFSERSRDSQEKPSRIMAPPKIIVHGK